VNIAVLAPAGTVTDAGTWATDVRLLESVTIAPPAGAGPFKVTVPAEGFPPWTLLGVSTSDESIAVLTVRVAL
jgi:hypothetical protein